MVVWGYVAYMHLEKLGYAFFEAVADFYSRNDIRSSKRAYARSMLCGLPDRLITEGGGSER